MTAKYEFEDVECLRATEEAIFVGGPDLDPLPRGKAWSNRRSLEQKYPDARWIPNAAVHPESEVFRKGDSGKLVVHAWFVEKRDRRDDEPETPPDWWSKKPPRGKEVPTPAVLLNRPLRPPGRGN
jgi:hypothetical protein